MSDRNVDLARRVMSEIGGRMAFELDQLPPGTEQNTAREGMRMWLSAVSDVFAQGKCPPDIAFGFPPPSKTRKGRNDVRSLQLVVFVRSGPAQGLGIDVPDGERFGELCRVRVRDLVDEQGERLADPGRTWRDLVAQITPIPDHVEDVLKQWDDEQP